MNEKEKKAIEILDTFELRRKTKNYREWRIFTIIYVEYKWMAM